MDSSLIFVFFPLGAPAPNDLVSFYAVWGPAVSLALVPGVIAYRKGRPLWLWWLFGLLLFYVALPLSIIMSADTDRLEARAIAAGCRKCRYCSEFIKREAIVCKHCGHGLKEYARKKKAVKELAGGDL